MYGEKGKSLSIPGVDKVEVYRAHTTRNPLQLENVRVPQTKLTSGEKASEVKSKILAAYLDSIGDRPPLRAHGMPEIAFVKKSLDHDFSRRRLSRQALSILTSHERMNYLLSRGTVLERRIKFTSRSGQENAFKKTWAHFWEVRGRVFIGNKDHTYTFSVYQVKGEQTAKIYDFKLKRKK